MLQELMIQNLAVIESATLKLQQGLTVLTGETGAGKSILIDAINLILGERSTKDIVRTGQNKARVEGVFSDLSEATLQKLADYGYAMEEDQLLISREISIDGKSTARLQGRPTTAAILRDLAPELLNIHGQHDNQMLLDPKKHLHILDTYSDAGEILGEYEASYRHFVALKKEYLNHQMDESEKKRRIDLLQYEVDEIAEIEPLFSIEEQLTTTVKRQQSVEKLHAALQKSYYALFGMEGSGGAYDAITMATQALKVVVELDKDVDLVAEQLENCKEEINEQARTLQQLMQTLEYNPEMLAEAVEQLEQLKQVKRKYGEDTDVVLAHFQNAKQELAAIKLSDKRCRQLQDEIRTAKVEVAEKAMALSAFRQQSSQKFVEQIRQELVFLDMPNVCLTVSQQKGKYGPNGCDVMEFLFSTNRGENPRPLHKIASGGELSRIMLALRCVLAEKEAVGTLIFDEIDAGVSGSSAQKIGKKLLEASHNRQVLCVTHSAQIAALSDHNLLIRKETTENRTYTNVFSLDIEGKIAEVARIMATDSVTDLILQTARSMVEAKNS